MKKRIIGKYSAILMATVLLTFFNGSALQLDAADSDDETWIPLEYQAYCEEIGMEYGVSPELLIAIIEVESSGQANVYNGNCKGLMQINVPYHKDRMEKFGVTDIYDPYGNILVGTDYLLNLFRDYEDLGTVLMIYNGSSKAEQRGQNGDYTEYAAHIMERAAQLERLHGK